MPGPHVDRMARIARANARTWSSASIERERRHALLHGALLRPDGRYLGKHRKLMPTASRAAGLGLRRRLDAAGRRHDDRPRRRGDLLGELHAAAADGDVRQGRADLLRADRRRPRHLAADACGTSRCEGRCFVLSANQFARRSDYPADYPTEFGDDPQTVISRGGSCIVGPLGEVLAGPDFERRDHPDRRPRPGRHRPRASSTSTWSATTPDPTCSSCSSTSRAARRSPSTVDSGSPGRRRTRATWIAAPGHARRAASRAACGRSSSGRSSRPAA